MLLAESNGRAWINAEPRLTAFLLLKNAIYISQ